MTDHIQGLNIEELTLIADILMGAAHADGDYDGTEAETIAGILGDLIGRDNFPDQVRAHLDAFEPAGFNVEATCARLHLAGAEDRRSLLALIADVTDADDIHDESEDAYIRKVAQAIGASEEEYADLTMEILSISSLGGPPPLPPAALLDHDA